MIALGVGKSSSIGSRQALSCRVLIESEIFAELLDFSRVDVTNFHLTSHSALVSWVRLWSICSVEYYIFVCVEVLLRHLESECHLPLESLEVRDHLEITLKLDETLSSTARDKVSHLELLGLAESFERLRLLLELMGFTKLVVGLVHLELIGVVLNRLVSGGLVVGIDS